MAKKIRFPLEMDNGIKVRSMEELKENFSLARVLEYRKNGKLVIWLRDRYASDIADAIDALDGMEDGIGKNICEIFGIPYDEEMELSLKKTAERTERINKLRQYTDDESFVAKVDQVAFDQDELYDLLDEDVETIYLCGNRFSIPLAKKGVSYIGINNPTVVVDSKVEVDWDERQISVEGVEFDKKYQEIIDRADAMKNSADAMKNSADAMKDRLYEKLVELLRKHLANNTQIPNPVLSTLGNYNEKTYLNFLITPAEKISVKKLYEKSKSVIENLNYNPDDDVVSKMKLIKDNHIIGLADDYLNNL